MKGRENASYVRTDVSNEDDVKAMIAHALNNFGPSRWPATFTVAQGSLPKSKDPPAGKHSLLKLAESRCSPKRATQSTLARNSAKHRQRVRVM
jgi:hypothetical protein